MITLVDGVGNADGERERDSGAALFINWCFSAQFLSMLLSAHAQTQIKLIVSVFDSNSSAQNQGTYNQLRLSLAVSLSL